MTRHYSALKGALDAQRNKQAERLRELSVSSGAAISVGGEGEGGPTHIYLSAACGTGQVFTVNDHIADAIAAWWLVCVLGGRVGCASFFGPLSWTS